MSGPHGAATATLTTVVAGLLLLFDGTRTHDDVLETARGWGTAPPKPGWLDHFVATMIRAGILRDDAPDYRVAPWRQHACLLSGACCTGPEIGPLPPNTAALLRAQWEELVADQPQLAALPPIVERGGNAYLPRPNGRCTFLDDANLCLIHARWGLDAKPLACRLFPLVAVSTEHETRLGISNVCMRRHMSYQTAEPLDLVAQLAELEHVVTPLVRRYQEPPAVSDSDARTAAANYEAERALLERFAERSLTIPRMVATAAGLPVDEVQLPASIEADMRLRARRWAKEADAAGEPGSVGTGQLRAEKLQAIVAFLQSDPQARLNLPLPRRFQAFLDTFARNHLFLRMGYRHGSMLDAMAMLAIGAYVAAWFATASPDATRDAEEAAYDAFGSALSVWSFSVDTQARAALIVDPDQRAAVRASWRAVWAGGAV